MSSNNGGLTFGTIQKDPCRLVVGFKKIDAEIMQHILTMIENMQRLEAITTADLDFPNQWTGFELKTEAK